MKLTNYMTTPYMWMTLGNLETELMKHLLCHSQGDDTELYILIKYMYQIFHFSCLDFTTRAYGTLQALLS